MQLPENHEPIHGEFGPWCPRYIIFLPFCLSILQKGDTTVEWTW